MLARGGDTIFRLGSRLAGWQWHTLPTHTPLESHLQPFAQSRLSEWAMHAEGMNLCVLRALSTDIDIYIYRARMMGPPSCGARSSVVAKMTQFGCIAVIGTVLAH